MLSQAYVGTGRAGRVEEIDPGSRSVDGNLSSNISAARSIKTASTFDSLCGYLLVNGLHRMTIMQATKSDELEAWMRTMRGVKSVVSPFR